MNFSKIDLDLWKEMQDEFSKTIGLPVTTIDINGNEIIVSGKYPNIYDFIKKKNSRLLAGKRIECVEELVRTKGESLVFKYCNGLYGIAYPVILFGNFFGLTIVDWMKKEDKDDFSDLALLLKVDKEDVAYFYNELNPFPLNQLEQVNNIMRIFSAKIPKLAFNKCRDDKKINELTALSELIKMINSSLDTQSILRYIMNFMITNLRAKDCSITVDSEDGEKKYCLKECSNDLNVIEKAVRNKINEIKSYVLINDLRKKFNLIIPEGYNSLISFPLKLKDEVIGSLNVYGSIPFEMDINQVDFLSTVSNQTAIAVLNAAKFEEVKHLAVFDKLTGVYNRRYFMTMLEKQLEKKEPVSLILTDIDDFGNYNNLHGHPQGDELLKQLANILKNNVRADDVIGRYGGEEFTIFMPKLRTNEAAEIAKNLKEAVEHFSFYGGEQQPNGKVTISLGLVSSIDENTTERMLIKEADEALYKAKKQGKNRFVHTVIIKNNLKAETVVNHK